eukprot:6462943-Amphidinium_carterae.2
MSSLVWTCQGHIPESQSCDASKKPASTMTRKAITTEHNHDTEGYHNKDVVAHLLFHNLLLPHPASACTLLIDLEMGEPARTTAALGTLRTTTCRHSLLQDC